jgi:murein DD-endopeptidase / murein LD-carboxypeptidase
MKTNENWWELLYVRGNSCKTCHEFREVPTMKPGRDLLNHSGFRKGIRKNICKFAGKPHTMSRIHFRIRQLCTLGVLAAALLVAGSCSRRVHPGHARPDIDGRRDEPGAIVETETETERERRRARDKSPLRGEGVITDIEPSPEPNYPAPSFHNIENTAEERRLTAFLDGGFGIRPDSNGATPQDIINTAYQYLGVRHCMGGRSKRCIDCSGLLAAVFGEHGIHLPHSSEEQARYGRILSAEESLREGDLVFFVRSYRTQRFITHSGIYVGNNRFIHTSSSSGVVVTPLDNSFWKQRFVFATRIF